MEKEILLMKISKISFSEMKYNVVIYYRRHLSEGKYGYRCTKIKLLQIICFHLFIFSLRKNSIIAQGIFHQV